MVDIRSVAAPSRNDIRLPRVSATTPVGTSKSTCPTVKNALAAKASVMERPASSRNSVLIPQMKDDAKVENKVSATYVLRIRRGVMSTHYRKSRRGPRGHCLFHFRSAMPRSGRTIRGIGEDNMAGSDRVSFVLALSVFT